MKQFTKKLLTAVLSVVICILSIAPQLTTFAETTTVPITGTIYEFGEKGDYDVNSENETQEFNSFGTFSISGELSQTDSIGGIDVYTCDSGNVDFYYKYYLPIKTDDNNMLITLAARLATIAANASITTFFICRTCPGTGWTRAAFCSNMPAVTAARRSFRWIT